MIDFKHYPVMKNEAIYYLNIKPGGIYADLTLGGGSHTMEIAKKLENGRIIAIDRDADALEYSREKLKDFEDKIFFVKDNYVNIKDIINRLGYEKIDGILADLGISSWQIDTVERGFSYMKDAKLDMRMDRDQSLTAYEIINNYGKEKLLKILYEYGEERYSEIIVREIIKRREDKNIESTGELADIIKYAVRNVKYDGGHPAKRAFQAVRIAVNEEIVNIEPTVEAAAEILNAGGRCVIIDFQSLEDRIIKKTCAKLERGCVCPASFPVCVCDNKPKIKNITKKPVYPGEAEIKENSRSASAKMRVFEKL